MRQRPAGPRLSAAQSRAGLFLEPRVQIGRGKYIARMDADDVSVRCRLLWLVDLIERHPECGVAGRPIEPIDKFRQSARGRTMTHLCGFHE